MTQDAPKLARLATDTGCKMPCPRTHNLDRSEIYVVFTVLTARDGLGACTSITESVERAVAPAEPVESTNNGHDRIVEAERRAA
jgi:hypothetical protein